MTGTRDRATRALSPVAGVVLLLALTLLLAGTAATYFVGLSDQADRADAPTAALRFDYEPDANGDSLAISHHSGDTIALRELYVVVEGATCEGGSGEPNGRYQVHEGWNYGPSVERMGAGFTVEITNGQPAGPMCASGALDLAGAEVDVTWVSPSGSRTVLVQSWD
jgi:flagellin-like protein